MRSLSITIAVGLTCLVQGKEETSNHDVSSRGTRLNHKRRTTRGATSGNNGLVGENSMDMKRRLKKGDGKGGSCKNAAEVLNSINILCDDLVAQVQNAPTDVTYCQEVADFLNGFVPPQPPSSTTVPPPTTGSSKDKKGKGSRIATNTYQDQIVEYCETDLLPGAAAIDDLLAELFASNAAIEDINMLFDEFELIALACPTEAAAATAAGITNSCTPPRDIIDPLPPTTC